MSPMLPGAAPPDNNVSIPDKGYREPYTLYDRNKYNAATALPNEVTFFISAYNENSKTEADTNMEEGRRLPNGQQFTMQAFGIGYMPNGATMPSPNPVDIAAIDDACVVEFFIDGRRFIYGKLHDWPAGFGLWGVSTASNQQFWQNGTQLFGCMRWFALEDEKVFTTQSFSGRLRFPGTPPTTVNALTIYMKLHGHRVRTVG